MLENYFCFLKEKTSSLKPIIIIAVSALLVFYSLYFFKNITLTAVIFLLSFSSSASFIIILLIGNIIRGISQRKVNEKLIGKSRNSHKKLILFFLFIFVGSTLATLAYIRFLTSLLPLASLASTQKTTKVTVSLLQDAYPAGSSYYKARASILKCKYADGSFYSCNGETLLFLPSVFIKQNYRGNATLRRKGSEIEIFSKGLVIEVEGHFAKRNKKENYPVNRFIVSQNSNFNFEGWASSISFYRASSRFYLNKLLYGWREAGSLLQALLTANRDFLCIEDALSFRTAGLSHVLALSGMHLAIIGGLAHFFSSLLLGRKLMKLAILAICFLFLIFAGASPSLMRSFLMLCILAIARLLYVKVELLAVLAVTFLLHLCIFPQDAFTLSFILSYSALFGILLFSDSFYNLFIPFIPDFVCASLSASLSATITTMPIIAMSFGQVSIIGVLASCIISPLISIFLVLGIFFIALSLILPIFYYLCGTILNLFYETIIFIIRVFAIFPIIKCETTASCILSFLPLILGVILICFERHLQGKRMQKLVI